MVNPERGRSGRQVRGSSHEKKFLQQILKYHRAGLRMAALQDAEPCVTDDSISSAQEILAVSLTLLLPHSWTLVDFLFPSVPLPCEGEMRGL